MVRLFSTALLCIVICLPIQVKSAWYDESNLTEKESQTKKKEEKQLIKIVGFGDSLMSGYSLGTYRDFAATMERALWKKNYKNFKMYKKGVSGETTTDALNRLDSIIKLEPDIVILEFGINDVLQNVSMRTIYNNLTEIIKRLKAEKIRILLIGMKPPPGAAVQYQKQFSGMFKYFSKEYKLPLYPFFLKDVAGNPNLNLSDGVHPNQNGVEVMVKNVLPYVEKMLRLEMRR